MKELREDDIVITEITEIELSGEFQFPLTPYQQRKMLLEERFERIKPKMNRPSPYYSIVSDAWKRFCESP